MSVQCLADANKNNNVLSDKPDDCGEINFDDSKLGVYTEGGLESAPGIAPYRDLVHYVRWPDDPLRLIHNSIFTAPKFTGLIKKECPDRLEKAGSVNNFLISENGLFCVSHYGKLNFLHVFNGARSWAAKKL